MKIKTVKIHNWRSIKDVEISFQDLMVFIGQNNHGKSNVLSGLLFFFGLSTCAELDYNQGCDDLFVEITFSDLDTHDQSQFAKYLTADGTIMVRKKISKDQPFEYHGYTQIPSDEWLKEENINNYTNRDAINQTPLSSLVPATGRLTKEIIRTAQLSYIDANRSSLTFSYELESTNFLGLKTVAQGIFGEVFFIPAVKNAQDEFNVKGKSVFNQLLTNVINDMSESNTQYIEVKNRVKELTESLNKTIADGTANASRPEQISQLESLLESELASWNTTINIEITPPNVDEVLRVGTNVWVDDGISTDVNRKGSGLQRSLIFALIKAWASVLRVQRDSSEGDTDGTQRRASKSNYFIFEEPELYLHPQAQRELHSSLKHLSEDENQVLISTHSSSFIDLEQYKSICILYKNDLTQGTKHLQCTEDIFSSIDEHKKFNLAYWINPDRGELFFAKKVILVEGQTEKSVLSYLARSIDCFRYDYTIIDCGSKDSIPLYMHLLNSFKLPYVVVYDRDHQLSRSPSAITSCDLSTSRILAKLDSTHGTCVELINDIEEEIGISAGSQSKPHVAMEHVSNVNFTVSTTLEAKINSIFS